MKKVLLIVGLFIVMLCISYFTFYYYANASDGIQMGELTIINHRGKMFKTWEGEMNQGGTNHKTFSFSVLDTDKKLIEDLNVLQGQYVKVHYIERYRTFPWWGESHFFVTKAEKNTSPFIPVQP